MNGLKTLYLADLLKQEPCKRVLNMYLMATYMILCGLRPVYSYFIVHTVSLLMLQEKRHRMRTSWCVSSCLSIIVGPTGLVWRSRPWWMVGYTELWILLRSINQCIKWAVCWRVSDLGHTITWWHMNLHFTSQDSKCGYWGRPVKIKT